MQEENFIKQGSGNVYQDLNYDDAEGMKVKADLVRRINALMKTKHLTQKNVSEILGIPRVRISKILNGQFRGVSEYKLLNCLSLLSNNVEIRIPPAVDEES